MNIRPDESCEQLPSCFFIRRSVLLESHHVCESFVADGQGSCRRANSLAHELSHILLEHPMSPALGDGGCRSWDARLEAEADWQAGALLVPRDAGLVWMRSNGSLEQGATHFGVSIPLFQWRVNQTG